MSDNNNGFPNIIKPERVIMTEANMGMQGFFDVELIHKPTGLIKQKLRFPNTITDAGLDAIGNGTATLGGNLHANSHAAVGTGNTPPTTSDTQLQTQLGSRTNSQGSPTIADVVGSGPSFSYWYRTITRVFGSGVNTGNLTEVGMFTAASGGTMWTRQLFKDSLGNPTTIVKTADDELRIAYELRLYTMQNEVTQSLTINSVSTEVVTRGYDIDNSSGWGSSGFGLLYSLGTYNTNNTAPGGASKFGFAVTASTMPTLTGTLSGTNFDASTTITWASYTNGNYYRDATMLWNPASTINPVGAVAWGAQLGTQVGVSPAFVTVFNPAVVKTNTQRFTFVPRLSWGRSS